MSMAALAHDLADKSGRTSVEVTIDGQDKFVLCTLTPGKVESVAVGVAVDVALLYAFDFNLIRSALSRIQ